MALSGTNYVNVGSGWRLQSEWSATQNISNNTSTITLKLYWMSLGSQYTVNSSATKTGGNTIDGTTSTFSGAGLASLSGNQKKLIATYTKTVTHNSDGTKSVPLSSYFDLELTLGGTYYGRVPVNGTAHLDTIPRESTLSSSASWTAGSNLSISISRASASFTHTAKIYVNNTLIKSISGIGTSTTATFTTAENTNIFTQLAQTGSKPTKITLETYDGSTLIGSNDYTGTCTAPSASTITSGVNFNIGDPVSVSISRNDSEFTHTLKFYTGNTLIKTISDVGTSTTWTPTSTETTNMYNTTPNSNTVASKIECITYYNGVQVRSLTSKTGTATVTNSNPIFGTGYTYKDTNATTTAITGNNQYIIQNKSTVLVEIPVSEKATAVNGATMISYVATLNGVSITQSYSNTATVSFDFGVVNANTNLTLSIKAIDSRGNSMTTTKTIIVIAYSTPSLTVSATRTNNFENETTLKVSGSFSLLNVGGINKNSIQTFQYRYKERTSPTWGNWTDFTYTTSGSTYTAMDVILQLDNLKAWNIEVQILDKLGTTTSSKTVSVGQPILHIDSTKKSISMNKFPTYNSRFEINGALEIWNGYSLVRNFNNADAYVYLGWNNDIPRIRYGGSGVGSSNGLQIQGLNDSVKLTIEDSGNITVAGGVVTGSNRTASSTSGVGGLKLNNSDITGANAIWYEDLADASVEGLNFLKTGGTASSYDTTNYDNLKVKDGVLYLNNTPVASSSVASTYLWFGALHMTTTQTVTPTKTISSCPNGWILVWSDSTSGTTNNWDFVFSFIPKYYVSQHPGAIAYFSIPTSMTATSVTHTVKGLRIYDDYITGSTDNNSSTSGNNASNAVLRYVLEW